MGRVYSNRTLAIENSEEYSEQVKQDVYVCRCLYPDGKEFVFKMEEDIIDFESPDIVHIHRYKPGDSKQTKKEKKRDKGFYETS